MAPAQPPTSSSAHSTVPGTHPATPERILAGTRVLLVTGEFRRATAWREAMLHRHFVVTIAHADRAGGTLDATAYHDVLIIDHATLAFDGLTLCRELRAAGVALPILMLHPQGTPGDLLAGFEAGADAYLCGSFSQRELLAQIGALRRRHAANESTNTGTASVVMG